MSNISFQKSLGKRPPLPLADHALPLIAERDYGEENSTIQMTRSSTDKLLNLIFKITFSVM
jgi:hypothetical protein